MKALSEKTKGLKILFSSDQIQLRIKEIAEEINNDFTDSDELVVVCTLMGAVLFTADLIKYIKIPVKLEFVKLSSYGDSTTSSGKVKPVDLTLPSLEDKDVLLVEDIVDTGLTANFLLDYVKMQHKAKKVKFVSMLDKACARKYPVQIDYAGFEVDDKFVVGYGLDHKGFLRNLPYIGYFSK